MIHNGPCWSYTHQCPLESFLNGREHCAVEHGTERESKQSTDTQANITAREKREFGEETKARELGGRKD